MNMQDRDAAGCYRSDNPAPCLATFASSFNSRSAPCQWDKVSSSKPAARPPMNEAAQGADVAENVEDEH
jgi:hypothetical protein